MSVRSNLTVLLEPGMDYLPEFYRRHKVKMICSMPCYTRENVDRQRGDGVFEKSIRALRMLNQQGYGKENDLELDLVYNPGGPFLPGDQRMLENDYKRMLFQEYGLVFNSLLTITNVPIKRFERHLRENGNLAGYIRLLKDKFNGETIAGIMCRTLLSVGWNGLLYDCDFNQALELSH